MDARTCTRLDASSSYDEGKNNDANDNLVVDAKPAFIVGLRPGDILLGIKGVTFLLGGDGDCDGIESCLACNNIIVRQ